MQDQCAGKSGAVLSGGAVDHQRRAVLQRDARTVTGSAACFPEHSRGRNPASPRWHDLSDSGVPLAAIVRSAATTVGSTGSECTVTSLMPHSAAVRSSGAAKSRTALLTPRVRTIATSSSVRWPRWLDRKICRQRTSGGHRESHSRRDRGNCWRRRD